MSHSHMHDHSSVPESSVHLKHKKKCAKGNDKDITRHMVCMHGPTCTCTVCTVPPIHVLVHLDIIL